MAVTFHGGKHDFSIGQATFISSQNSSKNTELWGRNICIGAIHDSAERCDAPKCYPETRVAIQDDVVTWLRLGAGGNDLKRMRWINGPAGAGKSAIMGSVAERCEADGTLAASFFFSAISANPRRQSKRFFIPTIAYQLAQHHAFDSLKLPILSAVERHPDVFEKNLSAQAERLILGPLHQLPESVDRTTWPLAIIIDGLDECRAGQYLRPDTGHVERTDGDDQREILQALVKLTQDHIFPFRILVASRPDPAIYDFFHGNGTAAANIIVLDRSYTPDEGIELYLRSRFSDIRLRYKLDVNWLPPYVVPTLVRNSSGQFAYPVMIMRFIDDDRNPHSPLALLEIVMRTAGSPAVAPLDAMYTTILNSVSDPVLAATWIRAIRWGQGRAYYGDWIFDTLLGVTSAEAAKILGPLRSLIKIPSSHERTNDYSFYHKSFLDYLDDPARSGPLYVHSWNEGNDRTLRFEIFMFPRFVRLLQDPAAKDIHTLFFCFSFSSILAPLACQPNFFVTGEGSLLKCCIRERGIQELSVPRDPSSTLNSLAKIFEYVHISCNIFSCTPVCNQWRADIRAAFEATGYRPRRRWTPVNTSLLETNPRFKFTPWSYRIVNIKGLLIGQTITVCY